MAIYPSLQETELLKLQVFALQQKKISNETEIKSLRDELSRLRAATTNVGSSTNVTNPTMPNKLRRVPFVFEITDSNKSEITKDTPQYYYIEDDDSRGLRSPGRSGYIKCDGLGDITYRIYDKIDDTWSFPATLKAGESDEFRLADNIRINTIEIIPNSDETMFRLRFSSGDD